MSTKNNLFRLSGKIQHYQWGGYQFIPELLHIPNTGHQPFAEYWLGAHDEAASQFGVGEKIFLNEYLKQHPEALGAAVQATFHRLPYLLKVLDVREMLSIQVHPSKAAAPREFERENLEGIPLTAAHRNYKDDNHKPELMVALGDFWLLHGFKKKEEVIQVIQSIPEFAFMLPLFGKGEYKKLYSYLMEMPQEEVNRILQPLLERILAAYDIDYLAKDDPHFWAARAAYSFNGHDKTDRGIFSIYLLNLVHLKAGEAIFQDAGVLHAYLEGQNMEIMANSNNVLRGGLTSKHIDVPELMKHIDFTPLVPLVIHGTSAGEGEEVFLSPASDFRLSRFGLNNDAGRALRTTTTDLFMVMSGSVVLRSGETEIALDAGEAAIAFAGAELRISSPGEGVLYRATAGIQ